MFYIELPSDFIEGLNDGTEGSNIFSKITEPEIYDIITSEKLYENFYFDMDLKEFLSFIQSPLYKQEAKLI